MRQLRAYKFLDAVKNAYSFCSFISVHIPANYPRQGLSQPSFSCFSCTFSCIIRCYSEQNAMCRFSYQEKVNCDSYHPAIVPRKISVGRLFKHHRGALIVDALLQQFMFKGFDFYIVIWKKPKFRLPRLKYEKLYSQANQKPPTFYIYIEIYIWRIINVWWVIITHLNWISFSEHLFFFVPVS